MEWIKRLNCAMDYIEGHLKTELDYQELAKIACCSSHHFQRIFSYMADVPLSEYIRRRRMTLAAVDLQAGDETVVTVGLNYGYESPTAFNRAFQGVHGISPSQARKPGVTVKAFPPICFKITIQGVTEMEYRMEQKDAFRVVGISQPLQHEIEKNFEVVPQMWQRATTDGTLPRLCQLMNSQPMGILGMSACNEEENWSYWIAVASGADAMPPFAAYTVPAATWAVFSGEGTNTSIQDLEKRIVLEWLPSSGYEYADAPDVEVYLNADPQNAKYEVWIPVVKK